MIHDLNGSAPAVREHRFLPLYIGWTSDLGIKPDATFVDWRAEGAGEVVPLLNSYWQRMAIYQGVLRYPELSRLLPQRPEAAVTAMLVTDRALFPQGQS